MKGLLAKKIGMTQLYNEEGRLEPITLLEAGPCSIIQIKNADKEGYCAVKLGFDTKKESRTNKPQKGIFKKSKSEPKKYVREIRIDDTTGYEVGKTIYADVFKEGDFVDITGISKGKGFQGGMKRWNWTAGKSGHGSMHHRRPGSIGASSFPSRVFRGQHMPGHLGSEKVTTQNLKVIRVSKDDNLIAVKGTVAGSRGSYLIVKAAKKKTAAKAEGNNQEQEKKE